jgi:hypothetical protein
MVYDRHMAIPKTCGTSDLSLLLGVTERRITQLVKQGVLQRQARGAFDTISSVHAFVAHRESIITKEHGIGAYGRARAAVYQERARIMRLKREQLEGSLAELSAVERTWTQLVTITKNGFLGLPTKSAPLLVNLKTPMQAQAILTPMVNEILQNLSETEVVAEKPHHGRRRKDAA